MRTSKLPFNVAFFVDNLIRVRHHSDEHVEQHNDINDRVGAKHQQSPKASETFNAGQIEGHQIDQSKRCPEKRLRRFEQTEKGVRLNSIIYREHNFYFAKRLHMAQAFSLLSKSGSPLGK